MEIEPLVDFRAKPWRNQNRCIELLDDGRADEPRSTAQLFSRVDRGIDECAGLIEGHKAVTNRLSVPTYDFIPLELHWWQSSCSGQIQLVYLDRHQFVSVGVLHLIVALKMLHRSVDSTGPSAERDAQGSPLTRVTHADRSLEHHVALRDALAEQSLACFDFQLGELAFQRGFVGGADQFLEHGREVMPNIDEEASQC